MRLITTNLTIKDVQPRIKELVDALFKTVPAGVGSRGFVKLSQQQFKEVAEQGSRWCVDNGYGWQEDLERIESNGRIPQADVTKVSDRALQRGICQIGTLGSGNHYLEIQHVKEENIFDEKLAKHFGLFKDQIVIMFHCLPGKAKVLTEHGYWITIRDLEKVWDKIRVSSVSPTSKVLENTPIVKFFKLKPHGKLFKIYTQSQEEITVTEDHPILTNQGFKLVRDIKMGEKINTLPYSGVEYEEPSEEIIVDESDLRNIGASERTIKNLKKKGLLPLRHDSEKLPILTKLLGYLTGDGWLGKNRARWTAKFIGDPRDLTTIKSDITKLGYKSTNIAKVYSKSEIKQVDGKTRIIEGTSYQFALGSLGLPMLFYCLGAPFGNKSATKFSVPMWLFKAPLWVKRLYLASYFGAEMSKPATRKYEPRRFGNCKISLNKIDILKENGCDFLKGIRNLLSEFQVTCGTIIEQNAIITKKNRKTVKLILQVSSEENNILSLWKKIGYEYNNKRSVLASLALHYLYHKRNILKEEIIATGKAASQVYTTAFKFRNIPCPTFADYCLSVLNNQHSPVILDEVQRIEEIKDFNDYVYDFTVESKNHSFIADNIVVSNCGSRGFGHQLATDYLRVFDEAMKKYNITVRDRELSCAPFQSKEGQDYYKGMACAANMAFANRQVILHRIREGFSSIFKQSPEDLEMHMIYDVAHNLARLSKFKIDGKQKELLVHRKGSTFCAGPSNPETPKYCRDAGIGSPLILGGSMETGSAFLIGTDKADQETFSSTAHGSGRTMSRTQAKREVRGDQLQKDMLKRGIYVRSTSMSGLAEEAGIAYKNLPEVVAAIKAAGISIPIAIFSPIGNLKG